MPGRIRIKFDRLIANDPMAKELIAAHNDLPPGVHDMRLNALARSVVIEYDAKRIPPALLEELVEAREDDLAAERLRDLDTILQTINA